MKFIFIILLLTILTDRDCNPTSIVSDYASAKQSTIGVNTEFTMFALDQKQELLKKFQTKGEWKSLKPLEYYDPFLGQWLVEEWRPVKDYEGHYEISNCGRIKSIWRIVDHPLLGSQTIHAKILKPSLSPSGYFIAQVSKNGIRGAVSISITVWDAFGNLGRYKREIQVDHISGEKTNNSILNLQTLTARENTIKGFRQSKIRKHPTGVTFHSVGNNKKKYCARITINKRKHSLGYFRTEEEASNAYQEALKGAK